MISTCLALSVLLLVAQVEALKVNAWQSKGNYPVASDFPENSFAELKSRPNTGITFSGGGSRSFGASAGYLGALHKLGLIDKVRYISGISGGAWAASVFSYAQNISDDTSFLGEIIPPNQIVYNDLKKVKKNSMRSLTQNTLSVVALKAYTDKVVDSIPDAFCYGVQESYLSPVGINAKTRFSWSSDTVQQIKSRNPELANDHFLLPTNKQRPFMVVGSTMVGPNAGSPYHSDDHNFTMMEFTSLYAGNMHSMDVQYHNPGLIHNSFMNKPIPRHVGGFVENYAFSRDNAEGSVAPSAALPTGATSGVLSVPAPSKFLDLQFAACAAGYAPGAFLEASYIPAIANAGMHFSYWSPSDTAKPTAADTLFTDGGCYENLGFISLLQREVAKVVLFENPGTPLQPSANWNVDTQATTDDTIDSTIPSFFGMENEDHKEVHDRNFMYYKNQVFAKSDYNKVIKGMQAAQGRGNGIITTVDLVTVENKWWGIPAGRKVQVTFVYLGRLSQWEAQLSSDMKSRVIPTDGNPNDLSNTIDSGDFKHYPHYTTAGGLLSAEQTNLLADMTGWSILQHEDVFRQIFA